MTRHSCQCVTCTLPLYLDSPVDCPSVRTLRQAAAMAEHQRQAEEAARQAVIVSDERARLLRGAAHLRDFLPPTLARELDTLTVSDRQQ